MSTQIQRRRGTTAQHASFTGAVGETTIDTDKEVVVVHDGVQVGGYPQMRENGSNSALALGSAGTPSLKFTGDTNTGIYSPGADQLAISTNGQGRLFVDASGNVGVGSSSPDKWSDANITQGTYKGALIGVVNIEGNRTTTSDVGRLAFWQTTNRIAYISAERAGADNSGALRFLTSNAGSEGERLRITSTGTVNFTGAGTAGSTQAVSFNGSAPVNSLVIDSSGRLGIGTSSPAELLAINGATPAALVRTSNATGNAQIKFNADDTNYAGIGLENTSLVLRCSNSSTPTSRVAITNGGNVGIGVTPSEKLHVSGKLLLNNGTDSYFDSASSNGLVITNPTAVRWEVNSSERARIDSSGRLLVGTFSTSANTTALFQGYGGAPTGGAHLRLAAGTNSPVNNANLGLVLFSDSDHTNCAYISADRDGGTWSASSKPTRLVFSTTADGASSPTERMRISSTGDIGVAKGLAIGALTGTASRIYLDGTVMTSGAGNATLKYSTSSGLVTYEASSRLVKENIEDCPYGIDAIKQLLPRKYFRTDDQQEEIGFIADEVIDVMPEFVPTGPKSLFTGNNEDDEIIPVGVNYDKLTAVLTKALQEAIAKIETLEAKVAALESA